MEEDDKAVDDVEDEHDNENKLSMLSAIPRSGSHTVTRPPSRPAPSARVRALSKDELDDVEQNSEEDEEEEEEEDDDDPAIQIEGFSSPFYEPVLHRPHLTRRRYLHEQERRKRFHIYREKISPPVLTRCTSYKSSSSESLSLSDYSSDEFSPKKDTDRVQAMRDQCYLNLPYHANSAYDPADFEHLQVSSEVKELFQFITRYTPQNIDLDTKLRPFIPEFIPAVGDIDAFIKVPRPDGVPDKLGLVALDEPCAKQSDPTVLDLQLRAISKETSYKSVAVKTLENADKRPKEIDAWINSISNLHRSKPPPTVHYSRNMPDIEALMQEWPPEFEETLNQVGIPTADLDCSLEEYVEIICGIMDIPVHRSRIQSLHVLFSLYLEFRNSPHFRSLSMGNDTTSNIYKDGADHLVIKE